jgi:hypothetical protein
MMRSERRKKRRTRRKRTGERITLTRRLVLT